MNYNLSYNHDIVISNVCVCVTLGQAATTEFGHTKRDEPVQRSKFCILL